MKPSKLWPQKQLGHSRKHSAAVHFPTSAGLKHLTFGSSVTTNDPISMISMVQLAGHLCKALTSEPGIFWKVAVDHFLSVHIE